MVAIAEAVTPIPRSGRCYTDIGSLRTRAPLRHDARSIKLLAVSTSGNALFEVESLSQAVHWLPGVMPTDGLRQPAITKAFLPTTTQPILHIAGASVAHPEITDACDPGTGRRTSGPKGAEEPVSPTPTEAQRL